MRWFLLCRTIVTRNHLLIMVSSTTLVTWVKVEVTTWRKHHRTPNTTTSRHTSTDRSTSPIPETSQNSSNPKRVRSSAICGTSTCGEVFFLKKQCCDGCPMVKRYFININHWFVFGGLFMWRSITSNICLHMRATCINNNESTCIVYHFQ